MNAQRAGRLRQALDDEHARHDRELREMPLEERLVDGDVLDADGALVAVHVDDAIDHQERIAMRQQLHHAPDIGRAELLVVPASVIVRARSATHRLTPLDVYQRLASRRRSALPLSALSSCKPPARGPLA